MGACSACGHDLRPAAKYCDECGSRVAGAALVGERKQVTVLFGDVAGSRNMSIGRRTLAAIVARYGGTVDQAADDRMIAVFGAATALSDHALRACGAALDIHTAHLQRDAVRFGLNSGEVAFGDASTGVTALRHLVDVANRMASAAPFGSVLLSNSTALLVAGTAALGPLRLIDIRGEDNPIPAHQLLSVRSSQRLNYG